MLWRESYTPIVRHDIELPHAFEPGVTCVAGAFGSGDFRDWDIWRRLFESAGFDYRLTGPQSLVDMLSPQVSRRFRLLEGAEAWRESTGADRAFAFVAAGATSPMLVIGPPTEDVWEVFERLVRELGSPKA